jgi:hypothetical protein
MNFFKKSSVSFICSCCGKKHDGLPMSYGSNAPYYWFQTMPEEREARFRFKHDSELCVMDEQHFFIRGNIEIPIIGNKKDFIWDVWVSLSKDNFERTVSYWNKRGREKQLEQMFGWLSTSIPCYSEETMNLKTMVHTRKLGIRPLIKLEPTEHPLAVEQITGVTMQRVQEIAETILHMNE